MVWEGVMAALTAVYVVLSFFEDATDFALSPYTVVLFVLSAVFVIEFAARCWDAPSRYAYVRVHWIDIITALPLVGPLRVLRLLRLLRFVRLGLSIRSLVIESRVDNLWLIWPCLLLFWFGSAYGLWLAEHSVNRTIASFSSALMYAFLTACTVGYGSFTPVTTEGKVISGLIVFVAIGLVGFTSARLTSMWLGQRDEQLPHKLNEIESDVAEIKELLVRLVERTEGLPTESKVRRN
jgi:voltage-gated potassium channel